MTTCRHYWFVTGAVWRRSVVTIGSSQALFGDESVATIGSSQALFGDEVSPLLARYIEEKEKMLLNEESAGDVFFTPHPKTRRQESVVQQLVKMIG